MESEMEHQDPKWGIVDLELESVIKEFLEKLFLLTFIEKKIVNSL